MLKFGKPVFVPNPLGIQALEEHPLVKLGLTAKAESTVQVAQSIAPVRTGEFRDSIRTDEEGGDIVVVADTDYAVYVELGTSDTPAFAVLRRAAEAG